ncbi:stigma-specific STIG1-like protein 1 [Euphorbia lathyris]|uniref:stigma-specific STIG1-like protein 1 n=1 Tax=Euphorbia lathyris TaxID=212925 RepID=UPI003313C8E6
MELIKVVFIIAITLGLSITLTMRGIGKVEHQNPQIPTNDSETTKDEQQQQVLEMPSKRLTRFLADEPNPRAADHCNKDSVLCYILEGKNYTCCNNKCMDLQNDDKHCGTCKNKCRFTQACCRGQCVYLSMDKRHCGACGNRCKDGEYCVYGMCSYSY